MSHPWRGKVRVAVVNGFTDLGTPIAKAKK